MRNDLSNEFEVGTDVGVGHDYAFADDGTAVHDYIFPEERSAREDALGAETDVVAENRGGMNRAVRGDDVVQAGIYAVFELLSRDDVMIALFL